MILVGNTNCADGDGSSGCGNINGNGMPVMAGSDDIFSEQTYFTISH